jgi:hypothetical protein
MSSLLFLVETILKVFGNAPQLFLSVINHYQSSESIATMSSRRTPKRQRTDRSLSKKVDGEPDPEPPAAPPQV